MSLVNEMLNDLEKRRGSDGKGPDLPDGLKPTEEPPKKPKRPSWQWLVLILIIVIVVAGVWYFSKKPKAKQTAVAKPVVVATNLQTSAPVSASSSSSTHNDATKTGKSSEALQYGSVHDVTITPKNNSLLVQFDLSQPLHYELAVSKNHQVLTLTIDKGTYTNQLPKAQGGVLMAINDQQLKDKVNFIMDVKPGTQVVGLRLLKKPIYAIELTLKEGVVPAEKPKAETKDAVKKLVVVKTPEEKAAESFNQVLPLLNSGKSEEAKAKLQGILKNLPTYVPARQSLAVMLVNQGDEKGALKVLDAGLKLQPENVPLTITKGQVLAESGDLKEAKSVLQDISPDIQEYPNYYELSAAIDQRLGEFDYAGQYYQQLLRLNPNQGKYWLGLGVALESSGKPNAAAKAYREAIGTKSLNANMQVFVESRLNELGGS